MPRTGGIYNLPDPPVIEATTIDSSVYNRFTSDVAQEFNSARPVVAGGTGATNATVARDNLDTEVSMQVVANYSSHNWEAGSFWSSVSVPDAPVVGHRFSGHCTKVDAANIILEARDNSDTLKPGRVYIAEKRSGTWNSPMWTLLPGSTTGQYVLKTGDTMTGDLYIDTSAVPNTLARLQFNTAGTGASAIFSEVAGSTLWNIVLNDGTTAHDFVINRWVGGVVQPAPLKIERATGKVIFNNDVTVVGKEIVANATASLNPTSGALVVAGGAGVAGNLNVFESITVGMNANDGQYYFGVQGGNRSLIYDGTNYTFAAAPLHIASTATSTVATDGALTVAGGVGIGGNLRLTSAAASAYVAQIRNTGASGSALACTPGADTSIGLAVTNAANSITQHRFLGDGTQQSTGPIIITSDIAATTPGAGGSLRLDGDISCDGSILALGYGSRAGSADVSVKSNIWNIQWVGAQARLWIGTSPQGYFTLTPTARDVATELDDLKSALQAAMARIEALEAARATP